MSHRLLLSLWLAFFCSVVTALAQGEIKPPPNPAEPLPGSPKVDPFQQAPVKQVRPKAVIDTPTANADQADEAFAAKKYAEAEKLYRQLSPDGAALSADQKENLAYCRLWMAAVELNQSLGKAPRAELEGEIRQALILGGSKLTPLADKILAELKNRPKPAVVQGVAPSSLGNPKIETANFRIHGGDEVQVKEVARLAEAIRAAMIERWVNGTVDGWNPRCDLVLHADQATFQKATGQADLSGQAVARFTGGQVTSRRIDLRMDDKDSLAVELPHQVTYLVLCSIFPDEPLPRWAELGMLVLSEPPSYVQRYYRVLQQAKKDNQLVRVKELLAPGKLPARDKLALHYAESVSLVDLLVRLKGARAFVAFQRELPRRGADECLKRYYDIASAEELERRWLRDLEGTASRE